MIPILDTTVLVDFSRGDEQAADYLQTLSTHVISIITQAELYEGCRDKQEQTRIEKMLKPYTILPLTEKISQKAIVLLQNYHLGHGLHLLDAFIIATALVYQLPVVTQNVKHFCIVKELTCIAWPLHIRDN